MPRLLTLPKNCSCLILGPLEFLRSPRSAKRSLVSLAVQWIRRVTGWLVLVYLDDFLLRIVTEDDVETTELALRVEFVRAVFEFLGLIDNAKSCLMPTKELKWLGWHPNSEFPRVFGSGPKLFKFKSLALRLANQQQATIHDL